MKIFYKLKLFCSLIKFFVLPALIISKKPDSIAKKDISIEENKISINFCRFVELYKSAGSKPFKSIWELLKTGILDLEKCSDRNLYKLSYNKGNIKKYLNSCKINHKQETFEKLLEELTYDKK